MAGTQTNNILIQDESAPYLPRTLESADNLVLTTGFELQNDMVITGNLTVQGTHTSVDSETLNVADNHILLNNGYTATSAQTGGLVVNYLPTATSDTVNGSFTAGVAATSNPTVVTSGSATFSVGQLILISGANTTENDGLYEVLSHIGTELTIRGVGTTGTVEDFTQNQFTTDATVAGTITHVNVSILRAGTDGAWEQGSGNTTPITFSDLVSGAGNSLQQAYEQGNQITTDGTNGDVIVAGTEQLLVTATGGVDIDTVFDFDGTSFDVLMSGANGFSIDGTAASNVSVDSGNLTLSTTTSGNVIVSSVGTVDVDGTAVTLDGTLSSNFTITGNDAGPLNLTLSATNAGAGTGNVLLSADDEIDVTSGGLLDINAGANMDVDVTGNYTMDATGTFSIDGVGASNVTATSGNLTISTVTSGNVVLNSVDNVDVDGDAITLDATLSSNFTITGNDAGPLDLTLSATNAGAGAGNVAITADDNFTADANAFSIDGTGASNVSVTGADLTLSTITSGNVVIPSAGDIDMDAANITADATASISLDAATSSNFTTTGNAAGAVDLTLSSTNAGGGTGNVLISADDEVDVTSGGLLDINAGANMDVDVTGTFDMLSTGAFSIDGTGASNVTATSGDLTISTVTSGSLLLTSFGNSTYTIPQNSATAFSLTDGADTYINVDSTNGLEALDLDTHVNIVEGAGVELTTSASTSLVAGDLVAFDTAGDLQLADANSGTLIQGLVQGVSRGTAGTSSTAQIFTVHGSVVPVRFVSAPAAGDNGLPVYLSGTAGQADMAPPAGAATRVVFIIGYLQGGDGVSTTVDVLFAPQFVSKGAVVS